MNQTKERCKQCKLENNNGICDRNDCINNQTKEGWEEYFRKLFITDDGDYSYVANNVEGTTVKDFINLILKEAEQRVAREILHAIGGTLDSITTYKLKAKYKILTMEEINPNGLKIGDRIFVEDAAEDDNGARADDGAEILAIEEDGRIKLKFDTKSIDDFYGNGDGDFYAKDYTKID